MIGMRRQGVSIFGAGVVILGAVAAYRIGNARSSVSPPVGRTTTPPLSSSIRAEGRVAAYPGAMVDVRAEIAGQVTRVLVQEGQQVRRGALVAQVAAAEERAALAEAQARLVEIDTDMTWLSAELQRTAPLTRTGNVSQQTADRIAHDLAAARARRAAVEATVQRLTAILAKASIVAPIDGTIISRTVESGEVIAPGARLVTVADLRRRRVEAEVDEYDVANVRLGGAVTITAEGYGIQAWQGTVEAIPDVVGLRQLRPQDPAHPSTTRVLVVKVSLPPDTPLKLGQRVELDFQSR